MRSVRTVLVFTIILASSVGYAQVDSTHAVNPDATPPPSVPGAAGISPELLQIDLQYREQANGLQSQLIQAQTSLSQCAIAEKQGNIAAKQADGQAKTAAVGQIVQSLAGPNSNIGDVINGGSAAARGEVQKATAKANSARKIAKTNPDFHYDAASDSITVNPNLTCEAKESLGEGGIKVTDRSYCKEEAKREANRLNQQLQEAKETIAGGTGQAEALQGAAINLAAGGVGAGLTLWGNSHNSKAIREGNGYGRDICEQNAKNQIDDLKRQMVLLDNRRANDITNASLQAALQQRLANAAVDDTGAAQGGINLTAKGLDVTKGNPFNPTSGNKGSGEAAPVAAAGAGGGGGSGSAGDAPYGFGNGRNDAAAGGGLPVQPDGATFASDGGGGGGGGFGFGEDFGFGQGPGLAAAEADLGTGGPGVSAFGDGGINTLMARARMRYAAHAADLVKSIDLKQMARAPASKSATPKRGQRL